MKRLLGIAALSVVLLAPEEARADETREQCLAGYEQGQSLTLDGKLRAAREQLILCARNTCPSITQSDCAKWLAALEPKIPTLVISARDASGKDLENVRVLADGKPLVERLDGRPIAVDPGAHAFRYESEGKVLEERLVIIEGEKGRRLNVDFSKLAPPPPAKPETPQPERRGVPVVSWVLGAVSVVGLASFGGFALAGKSVEKCVPACTHDEVSSFRRDYLVADISLGVALVAAGAALYFALTSPREAHAPPLR